MSLFQSRMVEGKTLVPSLVISGLDDPKLIQCESSILLENAFQSWQN